MSFNGDIDNELDTAADTVPTERQAAGGGGNLNKLPDGPHQFIIADGEFKTTANSVIFTLKIGVTVEGQDYIGEKTYWLKGQKGVDERSINGLKADLAVLGFDVPAWTVANGRPFTSQLKVIKPILAGLAFKGAKKTNPNKKKPDEPYVNIYVNERVEGDGKPKTLDEAYISKFIADNTEPF